MSDLDDLEAIAEQQRYGYNNPKQGITKRGRMCFHRAQRRGGKEMRSMEKQQVRSSERRRALVKLPNQG